MSYLIAAEFQESHFHRKLNHFRKLFDFKLFKYPQLFLPLFPSFSLEEVGVKNFWEEIEEAIWACFYHNEQLKKVNVLGPSSLAKNGGIIVLKLEVHPDFFFLQESIVQILKMYGVKFKHLKFLKPSKESEETLGFNLPLAHLKERSQTPKAIEYLRGEFEFPFHLDLSHLSGYKKISYRWSGHRSLFTFKMNEENYLDRIYAL